MQANVLGTSNDDLYQYEFITNETLEDALNVLRNAFFAHENVCRVVELSKSSEAMRDMEALSVRAAKDGISMITIEKKTGSVVGAIFNKLQVKENNADEARFFEEFLSNCKHQSSKAVVQYMIDIDDAADLFATCQVDCILEIMFVAVLPGCRGSGIGLKMCELSVEVAKALLNGNNVKVSLNKEVLPIEPIPQAVSSIFTSKATKKIMNRLNFKLTTEFSYEKSYFEGRTFASRLELDTPSAVVVYKKLIDI